MKTLLHFFKKPWLASLFIAITGLLMVIRAYFFEPHDFSNYYFGAELLKGGNFDSSIYFPGNFNLYIQQAGHYGIYTSFAPQSPFLALFFVPFTFLDVLSAKLFFNLLSLGLFIFSLRNLQKYFQFQVLLLWLIPLLFLIPINNNFLFGQMYLLLFFLLAEGFLAFKKERYWRMGVFWGLAVLLKVIPIILFGLLFFMKKYKAGLIYGACCIGLLLISLLVSGYDVWHFYFTEVLPKSSKGEITTEYVQNYQSMFMFLKGLLLNQPFVFTVLLFLFKLVLLVLSYFMTIKQSSVFKTFSFWIIVSILLLPAGNTYTNILLIFPLVYFFETGQKWSVGKIVALLLLFFICNLPVQSFHDFDVLAAFPRLFLMLLFTIVFIGEDVKLVRLKPALLFIISALILFAVIWKDDLGDDNALLEDPPLLTINYYHDNNKLKYFAWNQQGGTVQEVNLLVQSVDWDVVHIKDKQLFRGDEQLTFTKANKTQPAIVNDSLLIYLSDYKRGVGFFELRYKIIEP